MPEIFKVCSIPDGGNFADGNSAALAWDILHRAANHRVPETVDLSVCSHLKPYAIACLCGLAELAKAHGREIEIIPPADKGCADHLARLGVPEFFSGDWASSQPRATNIAVARVGWPLNNQGERIVEVLAPRISLSAGMFPRMVSGLDEIMTNALTHASSPIDCIVAGQAFPHIGKVEVAILDLGQTIYKHLTSNSKYKTLANDRDAIFKALEDGVTGTPDGQLNIRNEPNSGAGLTALRRYCESGGGELTVLSGNSWVTCSAEVNNPIVGGLRARFQGSLINIRYFTENHLPSGESEPIL